MGIGLAEIEREELPVPVEAELAEDERLEVAVSAEEVVPVCVCSAVAVGEGVSDLSGRPRVVIPMAAPGMSHKRPARTPDLMSELGYSDVTLAKRKH